MATPERSETESSFVDDANDDDYVQGHSPRPIREDFHRPRYSTPSDSIYKYTWDAGESAQLAVKYENQVDQTPTKTFPYATVWMNRAREEGAGGPAQLQALRTAEEEAFQALHPAIRVAVGRPLYRGARLDWEVRRYLGIELEHYPYAPKRTGSISAWITGKVENTLERFPDLSMQHARRVSWIPTTGPGRPPVLPSGVRALVPL